VPVCTRCGAGNRDGARFCDACGANLGAARREEPEPAAVPPPGAIANGRYELVRLLGEGGMKRVYLARDTLLERDVAVALIKAQAMGRLGAHPHVVASARWLSPLRSRRRPVVCSRSTAGCRV
jgi:hypothetical protein